MSIRVASAIPTREKPRLSFWQIWNMSFGFLGIQFGFALQNANVSRIFETLGGTEIALSGWPRHSRAYSCSPSWDIFRTGPGAHAGVGADLFSW